MEGIHRSFLSMAYSADHTAMTIHMAVIINVAMVTCLFGLNNEQSDLVRPETIADISGLPKIHRRPRTILVGAAALPGSSNRSSVNFRPPLISAIVSGKVR